MMRYDAIDERGLYGVGTSAIPPATLYSNTIFMGEYA
jgi:hypothetical protein